jgi:transcription elongation GreA/GreB family factor
MTVTTVRRIMSRAFVDDDREQGEDLPEIPQSQNPGYITRRGLARLKDELHRLEDVERPPFAAEVEGQHAGATEAEVQLARLDQRIKFLTGRIARAILVDPSTVAEDRVHFGAVVTVRDQQGEETRYHIVGEDEDDPAQGHVTCFSPLAKALLTKKIGEKVVWHRPIGDLELTILKIEDGEKEE